MNDRRRRLDHIARAADDKAPAAQTFYTLMPWSDPGEDPPVVRRNSRHGEEFIVGEPGETPEQLMDRLGPDCSFVVTGGVDAE